MTRGFTYEYVKQYINDIGYKLISDKYVNSHEKLKMKCEGGHIINMRFHSIRSGQRCPYCRGVKIWDLNDIVGTKIERLFVTKYLGNYRDGTKQKHHYYECLCECGEIVTTHRINLLRGSTKSCGCLGKDLLIERNKTHGLSDTRLYRIHHDIKRRCYNKDNHAYDYYGGRGIKVCDEWLNKDNGFINFYNWSMKNGYQDDLTIDRRDNNKGYSPENCRWVTRKVQSQNTRQALKIVGVSPDGDKYKFESLQSCIRKTGLGEVRINRILDGKSDLENGWRLRLVGGTRRKKRNNPN